MAPRRRYYDRDYFYFPHSTPLEAKGGIKAQSRQGAFTSSWWGKRWIEVVESSRIGKRLARGKNYARRGQVLSIDIEKGSVKAKVQGSRRNPYSVILKISKIEKKDWNQIINDIGERPLFIAKLLAGEMPDDIEYVFHENLVSLFPSLDIDLESDCNCPDWSNPCKHIAAIFYLLGEEFDRDPFLIFKLRGMEREELISRITPHADHETSAPAVESFAVESYKPQPLEIDISKFWDGQEIPEHFLGEVHIPDLPAALPRRLGHFPLWRGNTPFLKTMGEIYELASKRGIELVIGKSMEDIDQ